MGALDDALSAAADDEQQRLVAQRAENVKIVEDAIRRRKQAEHEGALLVTEFLERATRLGIPPSTYLPRKVEQDWEQLTQWAETPRKMREERVVDAEPIPCWNLSWALPSEHPQFLAYPDGNEGGGHYYISEQGQHIKDLVMKRDKKNPQSAHEVGSKLPWFTHTITWSPFPPLPSDVCFRIPGQWEVSLGRDVKLMEAMVTFFRRHGSS